MAFRRLEKVPSEADREAISQDLAALYASEMCTRGVIVGGHNFWRIFTVSVLAEKADRKRLASALLYADKLPEPLIGQAFDLPDRWMAAAFTVAEGHLTHLRLETPWDLSTGRRGRPFDMHSPPRVAVRSALQRLPSPDDQAAVQDALRHLAKPRRRARDEAPPTLKHLQKIAAEEIAIGLEADDYAREQYFEHKKLAAVTVWLGVKHDIALRIARRLTAQD